MAAKSKAKKSHRPLLAKVAITIQVPNDISDKEVLSKLKTLSFNWCGTSCIGSNGKTTQDDSGVDF